MRFIGTRSSLVQSPLGVFRPTLKEVAQQCSQCWREPVVKAGAGESLVGRSGVGALKSGDGTGFAVDGESYDESSDE